MPPRPRPLPVGLPEPKLSAPRSPPRESILPPGLAPPPRAKGVTVSAEGERRKANQHIRLHDVILILGW